MRLLSIILNSKFWIAITIISIPILLLCLIIMGGRHGGWTWSNEVFSALLGAVIVTAITSLLIGWQAKKESNVEQKKKVFENRVNAYASFLDILGKVVVSNFVTSEDEKRLQFAVATIGLHANSEEMFLLSKNLKRIIRKIKVNNPADSSIWKETIDIVSLFQNSLYGEKSLENDSNMTKALLNFSGLCTEKHHEVLEYVECMISDFQFDSFIADKCLFVSIPISSHIRRELKLRTKFKANVPKKLYITLQIEKENGEGYNGTVAIYCGKKPEELELITTIYNDYWQSPKYPRWKKDCFKKNEKVVELSTNYIQHAYICKFENYSKEQLRSILVSLFIYLNKVWAVEKEQFVTVMAMEKDNEGNLHEKRAKIDIGYKAADSSKFKNNTPLYEPSMEN